MLLLTPETVQLERCMQVGKHLHVSQIFMCNLFGIEKTLGFNLWFN